MDNSRYVCQQLREKVGFISELAKQLAVNRSTIYQSINGAGSRRIRIKIALMLETAPSYLWPSNPDTVRVVDDFYYEQALNHDESSLKF